jgi:hypothetical protein
MKLSQEEIEYLYLFTRKHHVVWYDLQTELVDHLANSIEEQWIKKPDLSFEIALNIVFSNFGRKGFKNVVNERKKALSNKYMKIVWAHLKEYYKLPQIIVTLIATAILNFFLMNFEVNRLNYFSEIFFGYVPLFITYFIVLFKFPKHLKKISYRNNEEKFWLFKSVINDMKMIPLGILLFIFLMFQKYQVAKELSKYGEVSFYPISTINLFFVSALLVFLVLFSYVIIKIIPSKAEEYLKQNYPEYELSE